MGLFGTGHQGPSASVTGLALDWVNEAIFRAAGLGGPALVMDLFLPMLVGSRPLAAAH